MHGYIQHQTPHYTITCVQSYIQQYPNIETESDGNGQIRRRLLHMYMCTYTDEADCQGGVPYFIFVADAADNVRGENLVSCGETLDVEISQMWRFCLMWRHSICGIFLDVKKFDMYREKDNKIQVVLPWNSWYLCCFVAKSLQLQFMLFCRDTYFVTTPILSQFTHFLCGEKLSPKFYLWRKNDKYYVWAYHVVRVTSPLDN